MVRSRGAGRSAMMVPRCSTESSRFSRAPRSGLRLRRRTPRSTRRRRRPRAHTSSHSCPPDAQAPPSVGQAPLTPWTGGSLAASALCSLFGATGCVEEGRHAAWQPRGAAGRLGVVTGRLSRRRFRHQHVRTLKRRHHSAPERVEKKWNRYTLSRRNISDPSSEMRLRVYVSPSAQLKWRAFLSSLQHPTRRLYLSD